MPHLIDPQARWYKLALWLTNLLAPKGVKVRYLAPYPERVAKLASILVFNQRGQLLLTQRSPTMPDAPGTWGLPGGNARRLEDGSVELFADIAIRQAHEEIGLRLSKAQLGQPVCLVEATGNYGGEVNRSQVQAAFLVHLPSGQKPQPLDETAQMVWADPQDVGTKYQLGFDEIDLPMIQAGFNAWSKQRNQQA